MQQDQPISLWDASAEEADHRAPLEGDLSTELAIVGGGFTGLSTALHAAERGLDAHVLEGRKIGYGGSGRNTAILRSNYRTEEGVRFYDESLNAAGQILSYVCRVEQAVGWIKS